jgi:ribosome biogenesis GTPase A
MAQALKKIEISLKVIDVVIELVDSRAPLATRHPYLEEASINKKRLIVLTKSDLADPLITQAWVTYYRNAGYVAISANLNSSGDVKNLFKEAFKLGEEKRAKQIRRLMKPQPVKAMVFGIPNVGKSTLINKLVGHRSASVADTPGHTKSQQWIKAGDELLLLDTPGILPTRYDNEQQGLCLAATGAIKDEILPIAKLADWLFAYLWTNYRDLLSKNMKFDPALIKDQEEFFLNLAKTRGLLERGSFDMEKSRHRFLLDFKSGKLGRFTLEKP